MKSGIHELSGTVIEVGPIQERGEKKFPVRTIILETDGKYPQQIPFELAGDDAQHTPVLGKAKFNFRVNGRKWNERYYVNLRLTDFEQHETLPNTEAKPNTPPAATPDGDDKLPF